MFEQYWHLFENWYWALPQQTQFMLAVIFVFWLLFNLFYNEKAVSFGPTILTTLGIFATFLGIALGLSEFDVNNVQASVPALLGGLKTAFWASVAGVGGALLLKFRHQFFDRTVAEGTGENGEVTGADLARLLSGIQTALVGNEETSLITQIKLMRSTLEYVLTNTRVFGFERWIKSLLTANGLSSSKPRFNVDRTENPIASQRVEFRVRTNADTRMAEILSAGQK
jgi:hypothetical protein